MNITAQSVRTHQTQQPHYQENYKNRPEHRPPQLAELQPKQVSGLLQAGR
jgi:hypothetical protein